MKPEEIRNHLEKFVEVEIRNGVQHFKAKGILYDRGDRNFFDFYYSINGHRVLFKSHIASIRPIELDSKELGK